MFSVYFSLVAFISMHNSTEVFGLWLQLLDSSADIAQRHCMLAVSP